jgi:hypothetical protein
LARDSVARLRWLINWLEQRLSNHLGIEAVVKLTPARNLAGPASPWVESSLSLAVVAEPTKYAGGAQLHGKPKANQAMAQRLLQFPKTNPTVV